MNFYSNFNYFVCYSSDFNKSVHYIHEISLIKDAKPNQEVDFVRYNREFVITVIVITEFDCKLKSKDSLFEVCIILIKQKMKIFKILKMFILSAEMR